MSEQIEGRNAVLEAFRSGKCVDKLFILDGCQDGPVRTIAREARKKDTIINYVSKERLDQLSETHAHQGVIAQVAAYEYSTVEDILAKAEEKGEPPFLILLDNVEDPHNPISDIRQSQRRITPQILVFKMKQFIKLYQIRFHFTPSRVSFSSIPFSRSSPRISSALAKSLAFLAA